MYIYIYLYIYIICIYQYDTSYESYMIYIYNDTRDHYTVEMKNGHHSKAENESYPGYNLSYTCIRPAKMHNLKRSDYYKAQVLIITI